MSSWVSTYANLFVDYAFTKHAANHDAGDIKHYVGVGVEGIGILRDYPNYPIRLSIGLDARKLLHYIKGESTSKDFYEIYFGLGFFF